MLSDPTRPDARAGVALETPREEGPGAAPRRRDGLLRDLVLVGTLAVIAVVYVVQSFALPSSSPNQADIGPRAYPLLVVTVLVLATVVLAVQTLLRWSRRAGDTAQPAPRTDDRPPLRQSPLLRLLLVLVVTLVYLQLIIWVGFIVATAVYLATESVVIGGLRRFRGRRAVVPVIFGVLGALAIYLLFEQALGVFLPQGMLGL